MIMQERFGIIHHTNDVYKIEGVLKNIMFCSLFSVNARVRSIPYDFVKIIFCSKCRRYAFDRSFYAFSVFQFF